MFAYYLHTAQDPTDRPGNNPAVWCLTCFETEDLVLRGEVFLCRDQLACQDRVRRREENRHGTAV